MYSQIKHIQRSMRIKQQLKEFADRMPDIRWIGLIATDGFGIGHYNKNHYTQAPIFTREIVTPSGERILIEEEHEEGDRVTPMTAATLSLSERISQEVGTGEWEFTVIAGKRAKKIALSINQETGLVAVVEPSMSIDAMLIELKSLIPVCEKLIKD
jgi:predicted regulator of Ras-like GTPase activity (Roadblock/LC7/MglB family)